jgi:hypothetical protein
MTLGPMHVGDTGPPMSCTFRYRNAPLSLSGATITVYFYNTLTSDQRIGAGSIGMIDAANGLCQYNFHPNDTTLPGLFDIYPRIVHPTLGTMTAKPQPLEIKGILT